MSAFLRAKADDEHVPSKTPKANKLYTAGGYVKHPLENFYKDKPVVTLDFNSLYPNVMIAKNMCYTTECSLEYARKHLPPGSYYQPFPAVDDPKETEREIGKSKKDLKRERKDNVMEERKEHFFEKGKVNTTDKEGRKPNKKNKKKHDREQDEMISRFGGKPCNYVFVQPEIREGILTQLLKMLLKARADVRALQKKEKKGSLRWLVLEGQQLAFKVVANSVYGFVKAFMLCMIEIMSAVTAEGRHMNYYVQHIVNTEFQDLDVVDVKRCRAMGLDPEEEPKPGEPDPRPRRKKAAYVVYGDTDSVMICFGRVTVADAYRWGKIVRDRCDAACKARFGANHNLEFESVKFNFLLMKKKRYASYEVLSGHKPGEKLVDMMKKGKVTAKGIESKRRDNAPIGGNTQGEVLDILVGKGDIEGAEEHVKNKIRALLSAEIDMSELVITQGLSKTEEDYKKSKAKLRHVALRDNLRQKE
jgi:DNA polymerase delta subunit 1